MGTDQFYEIQVDMISDEDIQLRDNAIESARQVTGKYLEKNLPNNYFFGILKYPHIVIREHSALGVAGADRISKGMKMAFGRPKGRLARIGKGEPVFRVRVAASALPVVKEAIKRAKIKMSGAYHEEVKDIQNEAFNRAKIGKVIVMKKVEEIKPKAPAVETAPAEGEEKKDEKAEGKEEKKAEVKEEKKK